ncbi:MAG: OmpA family protein [Candidatus Omnitrophica bacterium]|nr:OmpA family protein [Candidatus Omnitrophota bacterium]
MIKATKKILAVSLILGLTGCAVHLHKGRPSDAQKINQLSGEVGQLGSELTRLQEMREKERKELEKAKSLLSKLLRKEIDDRQIRVEQNERGLVITFLAEVLFDSGKAKVREDAYTVLNKVAKVLNNEVVNYKIGVEGHTDNDPIKYSGWKSNWELSTSRATSVLHYLIDQQSVEPSRISAIGYGEYHPITANDTEDGKQQNRRVEIVVLPKELSKVRAGAESSVSQVKEMVQSDVPTGEEQLSQQDSSNPYIK